MGRKKLYESREEYARIRYQEKKEYYKTNSAKNKDPEKNKEYWEKFKQSEKYMVSSKEWNKNNRERINELTRQRKKDNPELKIKDSLQSQINNYLRNNRNKSTLEYLGCSIKEYKLYLESLFLSVFTWKNHGKIWEIDHKIPLSSFDLSQEENIYKAFNYQNTQPIFKTTEIAKSFGYLNEIGNRNKGAKII